MCDWNMTWTIIGVNLTLIGILSAFVIWGFNKLDGDMKSIDSDLKSLSQKMDNDTKLHVQRTDQLYQMFIDLLKEKKAQ
jgi:hypothetical protein